jgi:prepilin peptidase CpaA
LGGRLDSRLSEFWLLGVPDIEMPSSELICGYSAALCAAAGSVWDLKTRRIPNPLTGSALLLGLLLHFVLGGWSQLGSAALAACIGGGAFFIFHLVGGMGGGDVKLMAAVCCLDGLPRTPEVLTMTVLAGGLFAFVLAYRRKRLKNTFSNVGSLLLHHYRHGLSPHTELNLQNERTLRLPYGVAIAAGSMLALLRGPVW